ncbi:ATP-binding cassette domain-containing protein [Aeromicrobium senzhongii]|uniref:ATP-binding cassette domain-containing protein n=1 Tax=Aeromicrobium senzhongii TaxID=2663859 RepID=A0ABX6SXF9_9ACTN|nr:ATP-binding cassette domain-containing protein [Aeromicrobium senzhongii]MTB87234.1 ATP-binding cassette domain-containing protein [Aeromicrobium senzhongii]QNL95696.1 ATP-binding cassette domain-containing protein [Aeromicrobium senzhongii]
MTLTPAADTRACVDTDHPAIRAEGVTKRYGRTVVVDDVHLDLPLGGVTALIGPNGAGKSTLLSIVGRLLTADGGRVTVTGLDVATTRSDELAKRMAVLRQENHLDIRLTVRDLVTFGRYPHSKGRPTADDLEHVEKALHYLDLDHLADRFLDQLSGGQRQRAFVAMVLCQDTDVVLLDEPLNNLDLRHAVSMMGRLRDAARELGRTVVVVVHDINVASCYADTIVAMRDGTVAACGSPADIMRPELLEEIYGLPVRVHELDGQLIATYYG